MAVIENDYAAYIQTADGEVPIRDLSVPQTVLEKSIENYYALRRTGKVYQTKLKSSFSRFLREPGHSLPWKRDYIL